MSAKRLIRPKDRKKFQPNRSAEKKVTAISKRALEIALRINADMDQTAAHKSLDFGHLPVRKQMALGSLRITPQRSAGDTTWKRDGYLAPRPCVSSNRARARYTAKVTTGCVLVRT